MQRIIIRYKLKHGIWLCITADADQPFSEVLRQSVTTLEDGIGIARMHLAAGLSMDRHGGNSSSRMTPDKRGCVIRVSVACCTSRLSAGKWLASLSEAREVIRRFIGTGGGYEKLRAAFKAAANIR